MDISKHEIKDGTKLIVKFFDERWGWRPEEEVEEEQQKIRDRFYKVIGEDKVLLIFTCEKDNVEIHTINE